MLLSSCICSYAVAIGYVLFDTYDKWQKTQADARRKLTSRPLPASLDVDRCLGSVAQLDRT
jgi:hypothetical protein